MAMMQNPELWVAVGVLIFFVLLWMLKVPAAAAKALDERAGKIQAALDEAERLREEARSLLASLQAQRIEAEAQAAQILKDAETEARNLEAEAKARLEDQIARRAELADRRIAAAEQQAAVEVKAAAADLAALIAEQVLARRLDGLAADPMVDTAIAELGRRLQ